MRRDRAYDRENGNYSTAFPLLVIGTTMAAMVTYLIIGLSVLDTPKSTTRVYVQLVDSDLGIPTFKQR